MKTSRITSESPAEIPTKNIPNESLQTFCYINLLGTDVRQKKLYFFVYFYDGLIFTGRKNCDFCVVRIQSLYTNQADHSL